MDKNFPRLLATLQLVAVGRKTTTQQIHQRLAALGYQVTRRTVQRDLEDLAGHYGLACDNSSKPYGWSWPPDASPPVVSPMDLRQALALTVLERECQQLMPPTAKQALKHWLEAARQQLRTNSHTKAARWADKVAIRPLGPPLLAANVAPAVQDAVNEALFAGLQISADYRSAQTEQHRAVQLSPLGLVRTGLVTYLVAVFAGHQDVRLLALHRMRRVQLIEEEAVIPPGFDLNEYLDDGALNFRNQGIIKLKFKMVASAASHLYDTPLSLDQTITSARQTDMVVVCATVKRSLRLLWWLRGFGTQLSVIEPRSLKAQI